jgi:hypothetical protein
MYDCLVTQIHKIKNPQLCLNNKNKENYNLWN